MHLQLWLVRHGETEWSASGQHTEKTDLPLTLEGKLHARQIAGFPSGRGFALVLASPLQRARETCRLAGCGDSAVIDVNLREWDYGEYEGRTTPQIQLEQPGWSLWRDGVIGGERIEQVAAMSQKITDRAAASSGDVLVFAHGHILRVITQWNGGAKNRAHSRSEIKMTFAERANQNATSGSESEKPACASADSARDLELSGPRPDRANEDFDCCAYAATVSTIIRMQT